MATVLHLQNPRPPSSCLHVPSQQPSTQATKDMSYQSHLSLLRSVLETHLAAKLPSDTNDTSTATVTTLNDIGRTLAMLLGAGVACDALLSTAVQEALYSRQALLAHRWVLAEMGGRIVLMLTYTEKPYEESASKLCHQCCRDPMATLAVRAWLGVCGNKWAELLGVACKLPSWGTAEADLSVRVQMAASGLLRRTESKDLVRAHNAAKANAKAVVKDSECKAGVRPSGQRANGSKKPIVVANSESDTEADG
ncbi:hypothetical protein DFH27DRAFT_529591 [Peziza echinospora]|nr:hypothetical protein DFH27DRAFT_529591 [Peziza echinospora]